MNELNFTVHSPETAPAGGGEALQRLHAAVGVIPNLAATMAESPDLLNGFLALRELYHGTSFSPAQIEELSLTAAFENDCAWCMTFHSAVAAKKGVDASAIEALRRGESPSPLSAFARAMVRRRGAVGAQELERFLAAGYSKRQALDVVLGMGFSLLANYAAHLTQAPVDEFLKPLAWSR
jgi:AhpD family alkylhydroperoxidase